MPESLRLFRQIGTVTLITGATQLAFLIATLLLGREMSQAEFGRFNLANMIINLTASLGLVGLNSAVVRALPKQEFERTNWRADIPRVVLVAFAVVGSVTVAAGALYRFPPLETALMVAAGWLFSLSLAGSSVLTIQRRFASSQLWLYLWRVVLLVGAGALLVSARLHTTSILVLYVLAGVAQLGGLVFALRPHRGGDHPLPAARLVREGLLFFGLFLTSTMMLRLDSFLIAGLVDAAALGRYSAASTIALTGYGVLSLGISQVLTPRVASGEPLHLRRLLGWLVTGGVLGVVGLTLFGTPLIHVLFAHRYFGDYRAVFALLSAAGLVQLVYVVPSALLGVRAPLPLLRSFLLVNVVSVAINALLNLALIPRFGLAGAAAATLLSWLWRLIWATAMVRRVPSGPAPAVSAPSLPG